MAGIMYIKRTFGINDEDIIVTHDAVRPFVSQRIIKENIDFALSDDAVDTVIAAIDTIVESSDDKNYIKNIPNRNFMYQGQTPQSFNINKFLSAYALLDSKQLDTLTDAAKVFSLANLNNNVKLVSGEQQNFKITTSFDLKMAESFVSERS